MKDLAQGLVYSKCSINDAAYYTTRLLEDAEEEQKEDNWPTCGNSRKAAWRRGSLS